MSNIIDKIIKEFDGVMIDEYDWEHHKLEGKPYDIRFHPMTLEWECSCPAYKFSRGNKTCKHIKIIQNNPK